MPTAREALLEAALSALTDQPWSGIRMVDVASAAEVSRQTLYNEFGSKDGLASALVRREADLYLRGVERSLAGQVEPAAGLVSVAEWTVGQAGARPLLRALLTGCWGDRLPPARPARHPAGNTVTPSGGIPAQPGAVPVPPEPVDLVTLVRDRSVAALDHGCTAQGRAELLQRCELAVRLALAHVVAPHAQPVGQLVLAAVTVSPETGPAPAGEAPLSAPSPRAAGR
jgi:AcrR family transcriptional regulator